MNKVCSDAFFYRGLAKSHPLACTVDAACIEAMNLENEQDFRSARAMIPTTYSPPIFSFSRSYEVVEQITNEVVRHLGDQMQILLLDTHMPSGARINTGLHSGNILMITDSTNEALELFRLGISYAILRDRIVRHPLEEGDNSIEISWKPGGNCSRQRFEMLRERLNSIGLTEDFG